MDTSQILANIGPYLAHTAPYAAVLAVFVTTIAYVHHPRLKAMVFSLPVPFTLAYLVTGLKIDPTHVTGLLLSVSYHWVVYFLRVRLKMPLWLSMLGGLVMFMTAAPRLLPLTDAPFMLVLPLVALVWMVMARLYHPMHQHGQRSNAPVWLKAPGIFTIAVVVYGLTPLLGGGVTGFPYAGLFTSYEMRRCLRTLAGQYTINFGALLLMLLTIWLLQDHVGRYWAMAGGWVAALSGLGTIYRLGIGKAPPEESPPMDDETESAPAA